MLRFKAIVAALGCVVFPSISSAVITPSIAAWANRNTVDSDGDLTPDLNDFAPGLFDNGMDTDNDGIGDAIDPTPINNNPSLGDPGLGMYSPPVINAGSNSDIDYVMLTTPPGGWGHIDLDLGGDGNYDATWFGPLTTSINTLSIPASLYTSTLWDLNTAGTYQLYAKAYAPGMSSQSETIISNVVVVPEPGTMGIAILAAAGLACRRRAMRSSGFAVAAAPASPRAIDVVH
jgi:hypothetical protein